MKDMVTITCYGDTESIDRKKAIAFYTECAAGSDGSEKERYLTILGGLYAGESVVDDGEDW